MKRAIVSLLFAVTLIINYSYTIKPATLSNISLQQSSCLPRFSVILSDQVYHEPSGCTITVAIQIVFDWDGPGSTPEIVSISRPRFRVSCPPVQAREAEGNVIDIDFDNETGHCTNITLDTTGDDEIDEKIHTSEYNEWLINEINEQIDNQQDY